MQCDEVWSFIYCKEKTRSRIGYNETVGDCYTWTAIERNSKLLLAHHVGKRNAGSAMAFAKKVRNAVAGKFQISTDGFPAYVNSIGMVFGGNQDFAQVVKVFGGPSEDDTRYSPGVITDIHVTAISGDPDLDRACTSHVERSNLTIRMGVRRFTRLTNAFSKLWENHEAMLALFFAYYNFCRAHMTLGKTPAMAAGLAGHVWSVKELVERISE